MRLLPALLLASALMAPVAAQAEGRSIIVLDASGSMWGQIEGRAKLEIAREALASVLSGMDPETEIGLMAYGHREKGSCTDIELVVPPAKGSAQAIIDAANAMRFLGKTPLSDAVKKAAEDLRYTEDAATVILITDGIETCEADPCALGAALEEAGVNFTAHVVGFGLTEEEGRAVACLAENTGGKYIQASDAGGLVEALQTTVAVAEPPPPPAPAALDENVDPMAVLVAGGAELTDPFDQEVYFSFTPLGADGQPAGDETTIYGRSLGFLPQGSYRMVTTLHLVEVEQIVEIGPDSELSTPIAVLDAGVLSLRILSEEGGDPVPEGLWEMNGAGGVNDYGYAQTLRVFPAGEYELAATLGEMSAREAVVITAGEVQEKTVILGAGLASFTAFYAPGVPVEASQSFDILEARPALDGKRKRIDTIYGAGDGPMLPPGDYVVLATVGKAQAEMPFTVKPGERAEVQVVLNAGIAAITAPNAGSIDIMAGKAALDGRRDRVETFYGETGEITLPAGDYLAVATAGKAKAETAFSVTAAERTEVKVEAAVGAAVINAPGAASIDILAGKVALDGKRQRIETFYGETGDLLLPPGDYIAAATKDRATAEAAFTVTRDARSEVTVTLVMGQAAVSAEGAKYIEIFEAEPDLTGKRKRLHTDYGAATSIMLPPGDYVAEAGFDDDVTAGAPFTITDGAVSNLTLARP